ncbi:MAG TPA: SCP2 sterol-binding domain-containing protein [Deltaproteobacteria bacterium]|nr:SCP2 sterol-binding domain-containing protein [Deltaproteobacteria bacterium]
MEYWKNENEPIEMFVKMFEKIYEDPELAPGFKKVNQLILFDYTQDGPNCCFYIDTRAGELKVGPGKPGEDPALVMSLSADDAHRSWSNKMNAVMAITRKKIKVKGSATGLLKLAPQLKKIAVIYNGILKESGKENIIL